jgi:hypothetical protein
MEKLSICLMSELLAGFIVFNWALNIKWMIGGSRISFFNSVVWTVIILYLVWSSFYNISYLNNNRLKRLENKK